MPDIQITDSVEAPSGIPIDVKKPSSLLKYLKSELLHLAVVPDFLKLKDLPLNEAARRPTSFKAAVKHDFQLGKTGPEIDITPSAEAIIAINASAGQDLFDDDEFPLPATVPNQTGYVRVGFQGSLDVSVDGSNSDLSFGLDKTTTLDLDFFKAYPLAPNCPKLGDAVGGALSGFVIPADLSDLDLLGTGDIAAVSGHGKLKISGAVTASAFPNPLASVSLPLNSGSIAVQAGVTAELSASFAVSGDYQIRAHRLDANTIELSILRARGSMFIAEITAASGVSAELGDHDLVSAVFGAVIKDAPPNQHLFADLQPAEAAALQKAVKNGLDHSLKASLDLLLSTGSEDHTLFQYRIQPQQLDDNGTAAVRAALRGDLSLLTAMESSMGDNGSLGPGIVLLNSLLMKLRKQGLTLHLNLIGLLNFADVSELVRKSEVLTDEVTGDVTIKEAVSGQTISSISEPLKRNEALRKALFESMIATTSYRAGKAVSMPDLHCSQVHFALNQNTNHQILADYLRWFTALRLLTPVDVDLTVASFNDGGPSTCVLRTAFGDDDCTALFFDTNGQPRQFGFFVEIGREAMGALLDAKNQQIDALRCELLTDPLWSKALDIGPNPNLAALVKLSADDARVQYLIGDLYTIVQWANTMAKTAKSVQDLRAFVNNSGGAPLAGNGAFTTKRDQLQKSLASMIKASQARFDEPWGMVSLFMACGATASAYAKAVTQALTIEKGCTDLALNNPAGKD